MKLKEEKQRGISIDSTDNKISTKNSTIATSDRKNTIDFNGKREFKEIK